MRNNLDIKNSVHQESHPLFLQEKFDGSCRLRAVEYFFKLVKRNLYLFLILPVLCGVLSYLFLPQYIVPKFSYRLVLNSSGVQMGKSHLRRNHDVNNIHAIVPDLSPEEKVEGHGFSDVSAFIKELYPGSLFEHKNSKIFIKEVEQERGSSLISIFLAGGAGQDFEKFSKKLVSKINKNFYPSDQSSATGNERRRSFLQDTVNSLETALREIERGLREYGFSAILIQEKNAIIPRISYLKGLLIKEFGTNRSSSLGSGLSIQSLGPRSADPIFPNKFLLFVLGFFFGFILASSIFFLFNFLGIADFIKSQIQFKIDYYDSLRLEESSSSIFEKSSDRKPYLETEALIEKNRQLQILAHNFMRDAEEENLGKIFDGWSLDGKRGSQKIAILTSAWWAQAKDNAFPSSDILEFSNTPEVFREAANLDIFKRNSLLEEAIAEFSGLKTMGAQRYFPAFSNLSRLDTDQLAAFSNSLSNEEFSILFLLAPKALRRKLGEALSSGEMSKVSKLIFESPDNIKTEALHDLETKLKKYVDEQEGRENNVREVKKMKEFKKSAFNSFPLALQIKMVGERIEKDSSQLNWFAKHFFNVGLVPFLKDSILQKSTERLPPSEVFKIFGFYGSTFLTRLIGLQEGVRKRALEEMCKNKFLLKEIEGAAQSEMLKEWFEHFKKENIVAIENSPGVLFAADSVWEEEKEAA